MKRVVVRGGAWYGLVLPVVLATAATGGGCHRRAPLAPTGCVPTDSMQTAVRAAASSRDPPEPPPRPLRRCFPEQPAWVDAPVADLLDKASDRFDHGDYAGTLACAEEAARQSPRSVETKWPDPGDSVRIEIETLGALDLEVSA